MYKATVPSFTLSCKNYDDFMNIVGMISEYGEAEKLTDEKDADGRWIRKVGPVEITVWYEETQQGLAPWDETYLLDEEEV